LSHRMPGPCLGRAAHRCPPEPGTGAIARQNFPGNWAMMPLLSMSAISSMWCSA
jgi:hypothetical protein